MGPTASGKTALAEELADRLEARLINADAFQVYRGLDIGTAKSARKSDYALVDIKDPSEPFGLGEWVELATEELHRVYEEGRDAIVVGGTGLYIRALFEGYSEMSPAPDPALRQELDALSLDDLLRRLAREDAAAFERVDVKNRVRVQRALERALTPFEPARFQLPPCKKLKFGLDRDPETVRSRIAERVHEMVHEGWVEEVQGLVEKGYSRDAPGLRAHGYRHIWDVITGTMELAQALDLTISEVRQYAKRQRTWLRKEPGLIWLKPDDPLTDALRYLN